MMVGYKSLLVKIVTLIALLDYTSCLNVLDHELGARALYASTRTSHSRPAHRVQGRNLASDGEEEEVNEPSESDGHVNDLSETEESEGTTNNSGGDQTYLPGSVRAALESIASSRSSSSSSPRPASHRYSGSRRQGSAQFRGRSNSPSDTQLRTLELQRARAREMRKIEFKKKILRELRMPQAPNVSVSSATRQAIISKIHQLGLPILPIQTDCYRAVCAAPAGINTTLWYSPAPSAMRLNFRLPRLNRRRQNEEVEKAKLNLFFKPRDGCPCNDEYGNNIWEYRVEVRQFIRKLVVRRNRVVNRTMYLESVNAPLSGNVRISLDITNAVKKWMERPRRNMGLEVRVTHFNGTAANASDMFVQTSCYTAETKVSCSNRRGGLDGSFDVEMVRWPLDSYQKDLQELQGRPFLEVRLSSTQGSRWRSGRRYPVVIANSFEDLMQRT